MLTFPKNTGKQVASCQYALVFLSVDCGKLHENAVLINLKDNIVIWKCLRTKIKLERRYY